MGQPSSFDATSLHRLRGLLGYESFVLTHLSDISGSQPDLVAPGVSMELDDSGNRGAIIYLSTANAGSGELRRVPNIVAPLIVSCLHRCLDMLFVWLFEQNGHANAGQWDFGCKDRKLAQLVMRTWGLPTPLSQHPDIAEVLSDMYSSLLECRHALTHESWGTMRNDTINFDFVVARGPRQGTRVWRTIHVTELMDASAFVGQICEAILAQTIAAQLDYARWTWLADRAAPLADRTIVGLLPPYREVVLYRVTRPERPVIVDLDYIQAQVESRNQQRQVTFDLVVEVGEPDNGHSYQIPHDSLPAGGHLTLTNEWDSFRR